MNNDIRPGELTYEAASAVASALDLSDLRLDDDWSWIATAPEGFDVFVYTLAREVFNM